MNEEHGILEQVYAAKESVQAADQLIGDYLPFIRAEDVYKRQLGGCPAHFGQTTARRGARKPASMKGPLTLHPRNRKKEQVF